MGFIRFRRAVTVLLVALMLLLFWLPQHFLARAAAEWEDAIDRASDDLRAGETERAARECTALVERFGNQKDTLERFLNHDAVDAVLSDLWQAKTLADAADAPGALAALAAARGSAQHLVCIERFTWNALL